MAELSAGKACAADKLPTVEERKLLEGVLKQLDPFKKATVLLQGEKYVTLSFVYPLIATISMQLAKMEMR